MKKIETIIRKEKFEDVKIALHEADIEFFTFWDVKGHGNEKQERIFRGAVYDVSIIERVCLSLIVRDINEEKAVNAILKAAHTGESGDGRIFIWDIEQSIRIRSGEKGAESLYNKD
jgi:nitrogen regulatory protein P-II 1